MIIGGDGLPLELRQLLGGAGEGERNRFKSDSSLLPHWEQMLGLEKDLIALLVYARMINSSDEDGANIEPFVSAVIDRFFILMEQEPDRKMLDAASVLLGEFRLHSANHLYIKRFAEHFKDRMTPAVAFYLHSRVQSDSFGGREAKEAVFNAIPEELQILFDLYVQAMD